MLELVATFFAWLLTPIRLATRGIMAWAAKEQREDADKRIKELEDRVKKLEDDPGYTILTYWDEDGTAASREMLQAMRGAGVYIHPRTIFSKKTGTIQEIPFPGDKKIKRNNDS